MTNWIDFIYSVVDKGPRFGMLQPIQWTSQNHATFSFLYYLIKGFTNRDS